MAAIKIELSVDKAAIRRKLRQALEKKIREIEQNKRRLEQLGRSSAAMRWRR